jgi:hypothetical protein
MSLISAGSISLDSTFNGSVTPAGANIIVADGQGGTTCDQSQPVNG